MNSYFVLSTLNLCLGGLVFLLGLVILRENPAQRLNRVVASMLFFGGLGGVLTAIAFLSSRSGSVAALAGSGRLFENVAYVWEFFFPTLFFFASIFPEERRFTRWAPRLPWGLRAPGFAVWVFAPHVFHFVLTVLLTFWNGEIPVPVSGPIHYIAPVLKLFEILFGLFLLVHQALFSLVDLGFGLATMALLFDSYRRAEVPRLRQQLRVIAVGLSACLICYSLASSIPGLFNLELDVSLRSVLTIAALTLGSGSIAYSIVRYKFLDAKLLARRGILYALASAALVGVYLLVVGRLNRFVTDVTGADARVFEPVFLIMALALFQPAISALERMLDRMFLRDPADYRNVLRHLGDELQTTIDLDVLLSRTVQTLADAVLLRTAHVVAFTREGPTSRTGAGAPLDAAGLEELAAMLPRVSARERSYRVADGVEGLGSAERNVLLRRFGVSVLVPLRWREDLVGALLLGDKVTGTSLTAEDVSLLTTLASQLSVSLQNALLLRDRLAVARFEEELNLARQIQRTSLLSEFPPMPRCDVHAFYMPSKEVGGDFYDVVPTRDGAYLMAIADVSGKGVPAALLSSMLQASLRTQAGDSASLDSILRNINGLLYRSTALNQFATFFLARVDPAAMRLVFSNAGHNWPVVLKRNGDRHQLERGGTVLGIMEQVEFEEAQVALDPGDLVLLYTDGMSEAENETGEQFGDRCMWDALRSIPTGLSAREVGERLLVSLREFLGPIEAQDDVTVLVLKVLEPAPLGERAGPIAEPARAN